MYLGENGSHKDESDEQLMVAYQNGNFEAFRVLYLRYEKYLYNFFLKWTGDREEAGDLLQKVFLKLHYGRHFYDPDYPFAPWLFTIARNAAKNTYNKKRRYDEVFVRQELLKENEQTEWEPADVEGNGNPEQMTLKNERKKIIEYALSELPESQREAILMHKYMGFSYSEIADMTYSSVGSVKQKIHRGYETLRKLLEDLV